MRAWETAPTPAGLKAENAVGCWAAFGSACACGAGSAPPAHADPTASPPSWRRDDYTAVTAMHIMRGVWLRVRVTVGRVGRGLAVESERGRVDGRRLAVGRCDRLPAVLRRVLRHHPQPLPRRYDARGLACGVTCWRSLLSENAVGQPEASAQCMPLWYSFHTGSASSADCAPHSPAALSSGSATAAQRSGGGPGRRRPWR